MASTLIRGKYVISKVTGPDSAVVFNDGAVFQKDGEILDVGPYEKLKDKHQADRVIGSSNYVVMPGLVNNHFHVSITPFQLGVPDLPLDDWLFARMGAKDVDPYLDHLYGTVQMIRCGTTLVQVLGKGGTSAGLATAEKSMKAYQDAGMRVAYAPGLSNANYLIAGARGDEKDFADTLPPELSKRFIEYSARAYLTPEEHVANMKALLAKYGTNDRTKRVRAYLSPSNAHRAPPNMLMAFKELAAQYHVPIHIHLEESLAQKMYGLRTWGKTPLKYLNDMGFLGPEVTCAHCVWLNQEDIDIMAQTGANMCHLPSSNLRLASGIAPLNRFLARGIRVGIGTDEGGMNDDADILQEMRLAWKIHRVPGEKPPTGHQMFQMATINGAQNAGFGDCAGTLEPGKRADIVLMNLKNIETPFLHPDVSIVDAVVQRGRHTEVDTVMIDGEIVLEDGRFTRIDLESLIKELHSFISQPKIPYEVEREKLRRDIEKYIVEFHAGTTMEMPPPHYRYNGKI